MKTNGVNLPSENTSNQSADNATQIMTINVMAVVTTDEQAIEIKRRIAEAIADLESTQLRFGLQPSGPPARRML